MVVQDAKIFAQPLQSATALRQLVRFGEEPQREPSGSWLIPGSFPVDQLGDVIGEPLEMEEDYEATTLGGLVSEIAGRIPKAGEVVLLEPLDLRVEVVASTGRRVERVRLFPPTARLPFPKEANVRSES